MAEPVHRSEECQGDPLSSHLTHRPKPVKARARFISAASWKVVLYLTPMKSMFDCCCQQEVLN